jgi:zinc protease
VPPHDPTLREPSPQKVAALTLSDIQNYYARVLRPDLSHIVIIGDVTPEEAKTEVLRWFGSLKAEGPAPQVDLPPVPPNKAAAAQVPDPTRIQDEVTLAEELPMNRYDEQYYPLQLANHILGGGFYATRLYRDLRQQTGYVYDVSETFDATRTRTRLSVVYGADPANVQKARALLLRDLSDLRTAVPSKEEMQQAVAMLLREIPLAQASESSIAEGLLERALMGLPLDEPVRAAEKYKALTAEQVRDAFANWVRTSDFVEVIQGPPPK